MVSCGARGEHGRPSTADRPVIAVGGRGAGIGLDGNDPSSRSPPLEDVREMARDRPGSAAAGTVAGTGRSIARDSPATECGEPDSGQR